MPPHALILSSHSVALSLMATNCSFPTSRWMSSISVDRRGGWERSISARGLRKRNQAGEELAGARGLFAALAGQAERLEQFAQDQPIADRQRRMLDAELRLGDLVLVELAKRNGLSVERRRNVLQPVKRDQCGIDRIARPAKRRSAERLADV